MMPFLVCVARAFQYLLWTFAVIACIAMLLGFPGVIVYGFVPRMDVAIWVTGIWWAGLGSIVIREKWDDKSL